MTQLTDPKRGWASPSAGPAAADRGVSVSLHGRETLLLVDDEDLILDAVGRILRDYGYEVLEAREPDKALVLLEARVADVRLLVTDLMMPGMSGYTLIARCRQLAPHLQAVVMSGAADHDSDSGGVRGVSAHFVSKPFSALALLETIRSVLDGASLHI